MQEREDGPVCPGGAVVSPETDRGENVRQVLNVRNVPVLDDHPYVVVDKGAVQAVGVRLRRCDQQQGRAARLDP